MPGKNRKRPRKSVKSSGTERRLLRITAGNSRSLTTINLNHGVNGQGSCAVFFVTATVENLLTTSSSAPLNVCIPANPLRSITWSGQGTGFSTTQQSDMTPIAELYDEFRLDGMSVHFQPTTANTVAANVRCGMIADYDSEPTAGLFATLKTLMEYENSVLMNPDEESMYVFAPNKIRRVYNPWVSCANSSLIMGGVAFALWNTSANNGVGNIVVKWRIIARGATF
jgi:hypothetical protein